VDVSQPAQPAVPTLSAALAQRIYEASHMTGKLRLRSGIVSGEYLDKYRFEADPHCTVDPGTVPKTMDVLTPPGVLQSDLLDYTVHRPVTLEAVTICATQWVPRGTAVCLAARCAGISRRGRRGRQGPAGWCPGRVRG
jgi:hypothetical protein